MRGLLLDVVIQRGQCAHWGPVELAPASAGPIAGGRPRTGVRGNRHPMRRGEILARPPGRPDRAAPQKGPEINPPTLTDRAGSDWISIR